MKIPEPVPYKEAFPQGTKVRVADRLFLEHFISEWKYHHPLQLEQLPFADHETTVKSVSFYHGGDTIYTLDKVPGFWLEQCLRPA
jgi:hypothetical protein